MRILFLKIASMKYYKGVCPEDPAINGGGFVRENGFGHEEFNFLPIFLDGEDDPVCLGFVEPKATRGVRNTIHIEKIAGCAALNKEPSVDDVLVIWCATMDTGDFTVVGWYRHAEVFRELQDWVMEFDDGSEEERCYNVIAKAEDCVLLPSGERNRAVWSMPYDRYTRSYGFGQSMVWFPTEPAAEGFLSRLVENIDNYKGENHLNAFPMPNPGK